MASVKISGAVSDELIYVSGRYWCGMSSGCVLLIVETNGSIFKVIGSSTIVQLPVRLLNSKHYGQPDIAVRVQGGGILTGYEAMLSFNGESYPTNPSVSPARRLNGKVEGKMLIPRSANSVPLY